MACGYHVQSVPGSFPNVGTNFILLFVGINVMEIEKKKKMTIIEESSDDAR
jgi:hypothetical protein